MALRLTLALLMLAVTIVVVGRRVGWLTRLIRSGQPAPGRTDRIGERLQAPARRGVRPAAAAASGAVPGIAHFFTFWGFVILGAHDRRGVRRAGDQPGLRVPDLRARPLARASSRTSSPSRCCVGDHLVRDQPAAQRARAQAARASRFYGSHTGPAWVILGMIALVVITLLLYRGAQYNTGHFPCGTSKAPFASYAVAQAARRRRLQPGPRDVLPARADGRDLRLHDHRRLLQAPAHRDRAAQRADQARARRPRPAAAGDRRRRASRSTSPTSRTCPRTPCSARARSRTSPGRATSTSRPAPSAAAASPSARPGTPASRCRRSS